MLQANMKVLVTQLTLLCPTLWDPMDYTPLGSLSMGFSRQGYWSNSFPTQHQKHLLNIKIKSCLFCAPKVPWVFLLFGRQQGENNKKINLISTWPTNPSWSDDPSHLIFSSLILNPLFYMPLFSSFQAHKF